MIVFGTLDARSAPARLILEFWLSPQAEYRYEDMQGTFQSDQAILVADPKSPGMEVAQELERQSNALAWTAIGLARMRFGQAAAALEALRAAEVLAPNLDSLQFFIGRASLFLSDLETGRQEILLREAEAAFKKAVDLNPSYATAHKALASTYAGQAQRLLKAVQDGRGGETELAEAAGWANQALDLYRRAAGMTPGPRDAGLFVNETARLGEGIALRIRAEIEYRRGDTGAARVALDEALPILEALKDEFSAAKQERSLIQTRQALGTLWQWRGFLDETAGDNSAAVSAYQAALNEYDGCLKIGAESLDRIVREDVAEKLCRPFYDEVKMLLDRLESGGSG
jgi:tetratricopeptide (TPR) repeat protein